MASRDGINNDDWIGRDPKGSDLGAILVAVLVWLEELRNTKVLLV
jgi:hypothetical protein